MSIKNNAIIIRDEVLSGQNTAARVGGNLVEIADDLISKQSAIDTNSAKASYTDASAVSANTSKNTYPSADATKLAGIEAGADVNTVNSSVTGEPTGSIVIPNLVKISLADHTAAVNNGTIVSTTFYIIN